MQKVVGSNPISRFCPSALHGASHGGGVAYTNIEGRQKLLDALTEATDEIGAALAFLLVGAGLHTTQTAGLALACDLAPEKSRPRVVAK